MRIKTMPFYPRLVELNQTGLWGHWAGHLSATRYDFSAKYEYFGVDVDTVGLDTRDFLMRSPQPLLVPLVLLAVLAWLEADGSGGG